MKFFNLDSLKKSLSELHIHLTIQNFALSLISIFIPIFLFDVGFDLTTIIQYYLVLFISFPLFSFFSYIVGAKIGFKNLMLIRPISLILSYSWLYSLSVFPNTLFFMAVFDGFIASIYWIPFHYFFTKKCDVDNVEGQVGWLFALPQLFSIAAPVIGAIIITYFSFSYLFIIVCFLLIVSAVPLLYMKDYRFDLKVDYKKLFNKSFVKYLFGFIADGVSYIVISIFLPIYIYVLFGGTLELGFYSTFLGLSGFIAPLLISGASKGKTSLFIKIGTLLEAFVFLFVIFAQTQLEFFFIGFLLGLFTTIWSVPFYTRMYKHAKKESTLEFLIVREVILNTARIVVLAVFLLFNNNFLSVFIFEIASRLFFLTF